jgi:CSLREA domain-containing protein
VQLRRVKAVAAVAAAVVAALAWSATAGAATFVVITQGDTDDGICDITSCSLREAIKAANASPGADVIAFSVAGGGTQSLPITLGELPEITDAVFVDGFSQPGGNGLAPEIEISGEFVESGSGLTVSAGPTRLRGLIVDRFPLHSVVFQGGAGNRLEASYLGTDISGTVGRVGDSAGALLITGTASNAVVGGSGGDGRNIVNNGIRVLGAGATGARLVGNYVGVGNGSATLTSTGAGISIQNAPNATVGSTVPGLGNVVGANAAQGIYGNGSGTTGLTILGNYVGTDLAGAAARPNGVGIVLQNVPGATVGSSEGGRNVVSGNGGDGIVVTSSPGLTLSHNYVGVDASGENDLGNAYGGLHLEGSDDSVLDANVFSGNDKPTPSDGQGIEIYSSPRTKVTRNLVGLSASGARVVPNGGRGIMVTGAAVTIGGSVEVGNTVGGNIGNGVELSSNGNVVTHNTIGTATTGAAAPNATGIVVDGGGWSDNELSSNRIANNANGGIVVASGVHNAMHGNLIDANGGLGIDLGPYDGVDANDALDADTGPNGRQNSPVITSVTADGATTQVHATLDSAPGVSYEVELYISNACDASGHGEGGLPFGARVATTTDAAGHADLTVTVEGVALDGRVLTATASDGAGNTSEFSNCVAAGGGPPEPGGFTVNSANDVDDGACNATHCSLREAIRAANAHEGPETIDFAIPAAAAAPLIALSSTLPAVTGDETTIDGTTQGGNITGRDVVLDGSSVGTPAAGIELRGTSGTLRGFVIQNFAVANSVGVEVSGTGNTVAQSNVGVGASGTTARPNYGGIRVSGPGNTIGGTAASDGNVVSGNLQSGIFTGAPGGPTLPGVVVANNYVGTDATGAAAVPNGLAGILLSRVTGAVVSSNVASGNGVVGIDVAADDNRVLGNLVGTNAAGTAAVPNPSGILVRGDLNTIGDPLRGNVVSGNSDVGIRIVGAGDGHSMGNAVLGNKIGYPGSGGLPIANANFGVVLVGASGNDIGRAPAPNLIGYNGRAGIVLGTGSAANHVRANLVSRNGTAATTLADGIIVQGHGNVVGGTTPLDRNLFVGNTANGVVVAGSPAADGNTILGNYIGVGSDGSTATANGFNGVYLGGSIHTQVSGNVISGNGQNGVLVDSGSSLATIASNSVGTNAARTAAIRNGGVGVDVRTSGNTIGGDEPASGNVIAGNVGAGLRLAGDGTVVRFNFVGTNAAGAVLANGGDGVAVTGSDNRLRGNTIANNTGAGVYVAGGARNVLEPDAYASNGGLGIDLAPRGVTPNDHGDADAGPNALQNFPELLSAEADDGTTVRAQLDGVANTDFAIRVYANASCDPSGHGEASGAQVGFFTLHTGDGGTGTVVSTLDFVPVGQYLTATATDPDGNTSEHSACRRVTTGGPPVSNVELTVAEDSLRAGVQSVALASIPPSWVPFLSGAPGTRPAGAPIGDIPIGDIPIGDIPIGDIPIGDIPIGDIPIGDIGIGALSGALGDVLLSSLGTNADAIVAPPSPLTGRPLQTITLADVYAEPVARARFEALPVARSGLTTTLLRGVHLSSLLLGETTFGGLGRTAQLCAPVMQSTTTKTVACNASSTLLSLDVQGAPIGDIPIGDIPIGDIPIGDIPIGDIPIGDIDVRSTPLARLPLSSLPAPGAIVDCTRVACATATLGDAAAANAILPTARLQQLAGFLGQTTLGELLMAAVARSDWDAGNLPIQGMQSFAGTGERAHYTLAFDLTCPAAPVSATLVLPNGFLVARGSSTVKIGSAAAVASADPTRALEGPGLLWSVDACGSASGATHAELRFEAMAGLRVGTFTASASVGSASVANRAPIEVTENWEENDESSQAKPARVNELEVVHVATSLDREVFTLPSPPRGWTTTIALDQVPAGADFDLSTTSPAPASLLSSPIGDISLGSLPLTDGGTTLSAPDSRTLGAETLHDVPLPGSTPIGDIPIGDIPIGDIPIGDISARRGSESEQVKIRSNGTVGAITIEISGYNGSHSDRPAVLSVKQTPPPPLPACGARRFPFDADPYGGADESFGTLPASLPAATQTLLLVARNRMGDMYGTAATAPLLALLDPANTVGIAASPLVAGQTLNVEADPAVRAAFAAWDAQPCAAERANDVVRAIGALIARYRPSLPNLKYVVVNGGDEIVPMARVADPVTLSPEADYAKSLAFTTNGLANGNALYAASALNYFLSDDALGTFTRTRWLDHDLFLPQVSVSRLVETPAEIAGQYAQFLASGGRLDPASMRALTAAIPFLSEGSDQIAQAAQSRLASATNLGTGWDSTSLLTGADAKQLWSVNAHADHFRLQPDASANGLVTSSQLLPAPIDPSVPHFGALVSLTMGCHAGLNVADTLGGDGAKLRDFAQAYAQQRAAVYVANLGFGYGETAPGLAGLSEKLFAQIAQRLLAPGGATFGERIVEAKHAYYQQMGTYGAFDEKVLQEVATYGPPWYRVTGGTAPPPPAPPTVSTDPVTGLASVPLSVSFSSSLARHDTTDGTFWTGGDGEQFAHYRMPQPVAYRSVDAPGFSPRGVELRSLTVDDVAGVDPFLATPTVACPTCEPEAAYTDVIYPASLVALNTSRLFGRTTSTVVLFGGQYRPSTPSGPLGVERLVRSASAVVYGSSSTDRERPLFLTQGATGTAGTVTIWANVVDRGTGIKVVSALYSAGGADPFHYVRLASAGGTLYSATVPASGTVQVMYTAIDGGGNASYSTGKGFLLTSHAADGRGPEISISSPADGAVFLLNQRVPVDYACSDADGARRCAGPVADGGLLDTATVGPHTFTVAAQDVAGGTSQASAGYVVRYRFFGFLQQVENDDRHARARPPAERTVGTAVTIDWLLTDFRLRPVVQRSAVTRVATGAIDCATRAPIGTLQPQSLANLRLFPLSYRYTYVTPRTPGCVRLAVTLDDGTTHNADFRLTRG